VAAAAPTTSYLVRLLEELASVLGLAHGDERLELRFCDGRLRSFGIHHERRAPLELAGLQARGSWLAERQ
jgi:hypothetical protein